jgi:murein DD-endopeptidase MepM/ murein hydrolase activator NlpD
VILRRLLAGLVVALVPLTASANSTLQQRINAAKEKSAALHAQLDAKRAELHASTIRVGGLQAQLAETNAAIAHVNGEIGGLDAQVNSTQRKLNWNSIQLAAAQKSLRLHDDALNRRLVGIYENGDLGYAAVLLSAQTFTQFVERWEDLRLLIAANETAIRQRRAAEQHVAAIQAALEQTRQELDQEEQRQQEARSQLNALADERRNLVEVADQQRLHVASQVAEMEDLSAAEEAQLEELIRERAAELEAERRAEGIASAPEGGGLFSWPVTGTITSPFGWRSNPFGGAPEFHQGLDIAAPTGTTVTAAASGTVIMAQWYGGYGNYILIDHGGGYSTGYGHLSAIYVSDGQKVERGQAIGAVGSTGESTGPHLHFEVRIDGKPVDPAPRLH